MQFKKCFLPVDDPRSLIKIYMYILVFDLVWPSQYEVRARLGWPTSMLYSMDKDFGWYRNWIWCWHWIQKLCSVHGYSTLFQWALLEWYCFDPICKGVKSNKRRRNTRMWIEWRPNSHLNLTQVHLFHLFSSSSSSSEEYNNLRYWLWFWKHLNLTNQSNFSHCKWKCHKPWIPWFCFSFWILSFLQEMHWLHRWR